MTVFGSFEPGFYGITTVHADLEAMDLFASYDRTEDVAGWSRAAGTEIGTSGLVSAPEHEIRHFHDFLLSPAGSSLMALQVEAAFNGLQAIQRVIRRPERYLPVPIARWMSWDHPQRTRWTETTGRHFGIDDVSDFVPLPTPGERALDADSRTRELQGLSPLRELAFCAEATALNFGRIAEIRRTMDFAGVGAFSIDDVFEGSAHVVQAQAIWHGQGAEAAERYLAHLEAGTLSHHRSFKLLLDALRQCRPLVLLTRMAELYTWMLLTSSDELLGKGNPATRLAAVLVLARQRPELVGAGVDTVQLWDLLDRATGQSWRGNLRDSLARLERRRKIYSAHRERFNSPVFDRLFATADMWINDSIATIREVLADPPAYAVPFLYITSKAERLPMPFIRHHFHSNLHKREQPLTSEWRALTPDDHPELVIAYIGPMGFDLPKEAVDNVLWAMMANFFAEYGFVSEPPDNLLNKHMKDQFKVMVGKEVVHVY
jgi:hypothetical protein